MCVRNGNFRGLIGKRAQLAPRGEGEKKQKKTKNGAGVCADAKANPMKGGDIFINKYEMAQKTVR